MSDIAISVENLSKRYRIGMQEEIPESLTEVVSAWVKSPLINFRRLRKLSHFSENDGQDDIIWALNDVSFSIKQGEVVGIIGENGAGKSTLLKILAHITEPTSGRAVIDGRVASLLEVGTGFHQELTGRENVYLNGTILGMTKQEIDRKFDEIVDFSGVERFIDTPVKRYSSGMNVRLAFAVAAHLEPEILLIDEVLAVGDVAFQKKCLGKMGQVAREGRTVLFVSHSMATIQALCQRVIQLEGGRIARSGAAHDVISHYLSDQLEMDHVDLEQRSDRGGSGKIRLNTIRFEDGVGNTIDRVQSGQELNIILTYAATEVANHVSFEISFYNTSSLEMPVYRCNTLYGGLELQRVTSPGELTCRIPKILLPASNYHLNISVIEADIGYADYVAAATALQVVDGNVFGSGRVQSASDAVAILEHSWQVAHSSENGHLPLQSVIG